MKRILNLMLMLLVLITLTSCNVEENNEGKEVDPVYEYTEVSTPFINRSTEYDVEDSNINLHFLENEYLPYIDIKDYFNLLNGVYLSEELEFVLIDDILTISIIYEYVDEDTNETNEEIYEAYIDIINSLIKVPNLDFFSAYLNNTNTNYSEGLISLEPIVKKGEEVIYDFEKYDFKIIEIDEKIILPLVMANLIFGQDNYFDLYYNGDNIYGIDTSDLNDSDIRKLLKSSYNENAMPDELKENTFNYYAFVLDYFYGLKDERNLESGFTYINKETFTKNSVYKPIYDLTINLDDLHTGHITRGYYSNKKLETTYSTKKKGDIVENFYSNMNVVANEAASHFGTTPLGTINVDDFDFEYLDNNKTLVIYILGFQVDTPIGIENVIKNAKSTTENIIIDLSLNTGGNLGAVLRMFTLMTNEEISYHVKNPLNNETVTYKVKGENPAYDNYNYIIKSSSVTFSAANLTVSIAKELGFKVIGRKSSGGASGLGFFVSPDGSIIYISSNMVLTDKNYNSIELGIEVDKHLNNLYNETEIINAIK